MKKKWLTAGQAAKRLCVSLETIYNMCKDSRLGGRYSKGNGKQKGSWLIDQESLELFEENTTFKSIYQVKKESSQRSLF